MRMGQGDALDVGLQIIKAVIDAGASIKVLDRSYTDLTPLMGRGFMAMMSAMAEDERLRINKRTHDGRKIAQAKGVSRVYRPNTLRLLKERRKGAGADGSCGITLGTVAARLGRWRRDRRVAECLSSLQEDGACADGCRF
jgi:resolvase-like protein